MPNKEISSPDDLVEQLIRLFPDFQNEWDQGAAYGHRGDYNFHTVFLEFGPNSRDFLRNATSGQTQEFCTLINHLVGKGGVLRTPSPLVFSNIHHNWAFENLSNLFYRMMRGRKYGEGASA